MITALRKIPESKCLSIGESSTIRILLIVIITYFLQSIIVNELYSLSRFIETNIKHSIIAYLLLSSIRHGYILLYYQTQN